MNNSSLQMGIQSTAGAIPVRNDKGEVSMQKVKVQRYISGKRPEYAPASSSDEESGAEDFMDQQKLEKRHHFLPQVIKDQNNERMEVDDEKETDDPRLRRLRAARAAPDEEEGEAGSRRTRHTVEPEVVAVATEPSEAELRERELQERRGADTSGDDSSGESDEELDEEEIELRRKLLRQKLMSRAVEDEKEVLEKEEEGILPGVAPPVRGSDDDDDEDAEDDEYTDSEEDTGPRLKPVFVRAKDRLTVIEREKAAQKQKQTETEAKREKEERRREALRLVEESVRRELQDKTKVDPESNINDVCTDDENDEVEYEAWKLREMKRIKRDKEERDTLEKEALEIERMRNMTEEERRLEQRVNPKVVTNKSAKGKYKFLQKYYHRGAFYLDKDEEVLKQDFSGPTLDDHFDKSVLPKVMQVKKFGRSGRTKYTHLVDQDTTQFDSPWSTEALPQNARFHASNKTVTKQVFDKPSLKRVSQK